MTYVRNVSAIAHANRESGVSATGLARSLFPGLNDNTYSQIPRHRKQNFQLLQLHLVHVTSGPR